MIEVAKDARHEFGALHIVACKEAGDKQGVRPDAGHAGMPAIIAPYGERVQLRARLRHAPIADVGDKRRGWQRRGRRANIALLWLAMFSAMFCCAVAMLCYVSCYFCYDFAMFRTAGGYSSNLQFQIHNAVGVTPSPLPDVPAESGSRPGPVGPCVTGFPQ